MRARPGRDRGPFADDGYLGPGALTPPILPRRNMIKYIGSKRALVPLICEAVRSIGSGRSALDLFSGTARVGRALKEMGLFVTCNDHNAYAHALARCYVQADRRVLLDKAAVVLDDLRRVEPDPGYFTETFCVRSRFFHPRNGGRIDAIRERIAAMGLEPDLEAVALVSLMEAADRVDSTTGVQMAYLKAWATRAHKDLELRMPALVDGRGAALCLDAAEAADAVEADIAYVDPPYNQHSYRGNYHIWETLVRWDKPEVYGAACKRVDCRTYTSPFNSRRNALPALADVLRRLRCRNAIVSFSNEGFIERADMESLLSERGLVVPIEIDYRRYVGCRIGIHNPQGVKVGSVSHVRNTEVLYVVTEDRGVYERTQAIAVLAARGRNSQMAVGS